jgi:hypothetical protein
MMIKRGEMDIICLAGSMFGMKLLAPRNMIKCKTLFYYCKHDDDEMFEEDIVYGSSSETQITLCAK